MSTEDRLMAHGLMPVEGRPLRFHHLVNCRMFAKTVWTDKFLLKQEEGFTHDRLHEIIHANEEYFYDNCPGDLIVKGWYEEFKKEVC